MRFDVERNHLAALLTQVTKAVNSRNTVPVLACVRLVNEGTRLTATATNLDIEITGSIESSGDAGATCVDAKLLAGIVAKLPGGTVAIEADGNTATVKSGRSRFKLSTLPVEDFPTLEAGEFTAEFETDPSALFAPVAFAMSEEQTRFYLCGIYLQPTAVTATDGHRLSTVAHEFGVDFEPVIVPSGTVAIAPKGKTKVRLSNRKIQFVTDNAVITSRLIDGTYPDYERVIPRNQGNVAVFDNAALRAAADRVSLVSKDKTPTVRLDLTSEEITITARGEGEGRDVVACAYDGPAQAVGFNAGYLAAVLGSLPAGEIRMAVGEANGPIVFTSDSAPEQRVVLMPVRVS